MSLYTFCRGSCQNNIGNKLLECGKLLQAIHFYKCDYLQLSGLKHLDSPKAHITINNCNNVSVSNLHIIAPEDSPNTDGIDISMSTFVNIHNSTIGTGNINASNLLSLSLISNIIIVN